MKITLEISSQDIADLMVTAIEGNHMVRAWCAGVYLIEPKGFERDGFTKGPWYSKKEVWEKSFKIHVEELIDESLPPTGKNIKKHIVTSVDFAEGFKLMAKNSPDHFSDFMSGNYDAITADVFLQYAALKEVVYG